MILACFLLGMGAVFLAVGVIQTCLGDGHKTYIKVFLTIGAMLVFIVAMGMIIKAGKIDDCVIHGKYKLHVVNVVKDGKITSAATNVEYGE